MSDEKYEDLWRPTYELLAASGWAFTTAISLVSPAFIQVPGSYGIASGILGGAMCAIRTRQSLNHLRFREKLAGAQFFYLSMDELEKRRQEKKMWFGLGWDWKPIHTARCYQAMKKDVTSYYPPAWYLKAKKIPDPNKVIGSPWIHGLEPEESDIQIDDAATEGHNLVLGTTGAGKTRMLETIVTQYCKNGAKNGNTTIIIDPKGDKELAEIARTACEQAGQPEKFISFHPAFPSTSVRFDPLRNWTRETQIASRIAMLTGGDPNDSFTQFAWRAINNVSNGLLFIGIRPNLKLIKQYVAGGPDDLLEKVLVKYFDDHMDGWRSQILSLIETVKSSKGKFPTRITAGSVELIAYVDYFKRNVPENIRPAPVVSLLEITEHDRSHYGKVISNILPILEMLTSGDLGSMLSPDAADMDDKRLIMDSTKVIEGGYTLYIGLDSLSDATVGSAIAGIILADLAAKAGEMYNYNDEFKKINLIIDEASEVVNEPLIQLLNKGRGSGFIIWLLSQTFSDFVAKMGGSEPKARQMLGNCNNFYSLRVVEELTKQYVAERFGTTYITELSKSYGSSERGQESGSAQSGNISLSSKETQVELIPATILGKLPAMHYIGLVAGGKTIKGRLPKLTLN